MNGINKMKKLLLLLFITVILTSCDQPEYRWVSAGQLTSFRVDDDAEFHFTTDNLTENDVSPYIIVIKRIPGCQPEVFKRQIRCLGMCNHGNKDWTDCSRFDGYFIQIPPDYKIETFDD